MDPSLKTLLNQVITYKAESGRNTSGDPTFGNAQVMKAYVENKKIIVELPTGEKRETSHWICTEDEIKTTYRIWLPGETTSDDDQAHTISSVEKFVDDKGNVDHYETMVF